MELITAATVIPLNATICLVLAVAHLNGPVLSCRSVPLLGSTSTTRTGSPELLIGRGEMHTHHSHLLLCCAFVLPMPGPPLLVFPDLVSGNLGGAGGIVYSRCYHLYLSEGDSTLFRLMLAGRCLNPWRIDGMPLTLRSKCYDDQLGFS